MGWRGSSNKKADKGTICHKVLEALAILKKAEQDKKRFINDDVYGRVGRLKFAARSVDSLVEESYHYYTSRLTHHEWLPVDLKDCKLWVKKAISLNGGMFDPRNRTIVEPEPHFDFEIDEPWAEFEFELHGKPIIGKLALKGTIDLITEISPGFYEIIDWKTGRRLDWATGKEKDYEYLMNDPQLRIYHYAVTKLFPDVEHIMVTIYFINDGGPFSMSFSKKDLTRTKEMLKDKFERIKATQIPILNKGWKCQKLCHFGKNKFENPMIETRTGQFTKRGEEMTMCQEVDYMIRAKGIDWVTENYTKPGHQVANYKAPGTV